jgi:hypothetical protein
MQTTIASKQTMQRVSGCIRGMEGLLRLNSPSYWVVCAQSVVSLVILLMWGNALHGQVESATVVGTVRDAGGGTVADVHVTIVQTETNLARQSNTNELGEYAFTQLKPGTYTISAERAGFKKVVERDFKLDVNQTARMDLNLVLGAVSEEVEVEAVEPLVESETSSIGQVIEQRRIQDLPLNGRNFIQLAYLSPGVNQGPPGAVQQGGVPENERGTGSIQANGLTATNNNFLLNGFDNNEQQLGFEVIQPPEDAIQEFKVQTSNFGADIGKGGAVVNVVLKSGTNHFHGSAFDFLRNSALDAKNFFDRKDFPIPPFKQNQFGGSFGGPILRDKTFFFVDYQGERVRQSQTLISTVPVPGPELRGDFSDLLTGSNDLATGFDTGAIFDPLTTVNGVRQPFPGNKIPSCPSPLGPGHSCLDPAALNVIALFPAPNRHAPGDPVGVNNFLSNPLFQNNQDAFDVRLDHQLSASDVFFGYFSYGNVDNIRPDPFPGLAGGGSFSGNVSNKARAVGLSALHTFSPTKANELKIGYMRYAVDARPFFLGQPIATRLGVPGVNDPAIPATGGLPSIGIGSFSALGNQAFFPEVLNENNYQLLDSFTYTRGRHALKFGADLRRRSHGFFQTVNPRGSLSFDSTMTANPISCGGSGIQCGSALASFLLGYPTFASRDQQKGLFGMSWWEVSGYAMDDFRVSHKLTVNLGLRYDVNTPMIEQHNRLANFDFKTGLFVAPGMPNVSRSGNVVTDLNNFAPRIGFAYTPWDDNKTVFRGAYGIFYDLQADQNDAELAYNPTGLFGSQVFQNLPTTAVPAVKLSQGFPQPVPFPTVNQPSGRASAAFFNNRTTYIEEWNFNVERQLAKDAVLQVAYVGVHGLKLSFLRNMNQPLQPLDSNFQLDPVTGFSTNFGRRYFSTVPNIAGIRVEGHDASSISHGLQVRFEKRFSANWTMLDSYTWQHTIGQVEENEFFEPQNTYNLKAERGSLTPDFRHQFTSAWSYQVPFGPGQRFFTSTGPLRWVVGGWQLNGIIGLYSGAAFTPTLSFDRTNTGSGYPRPDVVGNPYDFSNATSFGCPSNHQSLSCWYNPGAFRVPALAPGQQFAHVFGNAGRGILRGPAQYNFDFSVFKNFKFAETANVQLRAEVFNLFNAPQFGLPNTLTDIPGLAGSISGTTNSSRQIQLALRVTF